MTYQQEFKLLAELFSIALSLDNRMYSEQEKVQFVYKPVHNNKVVNNHICSGSNSGKYQLTYSSREHEKEKINTNGKKKVKKEKPDVSGKSAKFVAVSPKVTLKDVKRKDRKHRSIISSPSMKRRSFSNHVASSGVWGKIADYGGFNGRLIYINAGHGR